MEMYLRTEVLRFIGKMLPRDCACQSELRVRIK